MKATRTPVTMTALFTVDLFAVVNAVYAEIIAIQLAHQADMFDRVSHEILAPAYYVPDDDDDEA